MTPTTACIRALKVFQVETVLIPTQDFHLSRSVYTARHLGLEATGVVADIQPYMDESKNAAREILARVKAVLQLYVTHPGSAELGGPYPITGDGQAVATGRGLHSSAVSMSAGYAQSMPT